MAQSLCATKLEEMVQCAICFEPLDQPLTFKCFHSFCSKCTGGFQTETVDGREAYSCPECRQHTHTDELQRTHLLTNLLELHQLFLDEQKPCSKCEKNQPTWRCLQCKSNCCDTCKKDHDFYPMLKDHHLVLLSDANNSLNVDKVIYCDAHKDKMLELHCQPCDALICYLCKAVEHDGHGCKTVEQSLKSLLPSIEKHRDVIASCKTTELSVLSKLEKEIETNSDIYDKLEESISKRKGEIEKQLNREHATLMHKVEVLRLKRRYELEKQKKEVESSLKEKQGILTWTENLLSTTQGVSLLTELRGNVKSQLETIAARKETAIAESSTEIVFLPAVSTQINLVGTLATPPESHLKYEASATKTSTQDSKENLEDVSTQHKHKPVSRLHDFSFVRIHNRAIKLDSHVPPAHLSYRAVSIVRNEDKLFVLGHGSNVVHTHDTQLENATRSHEVIPLTHMEIARGLAVVGERLIIASNQGLFVAQLDGKNIQQVTKEMTMALAEHDNTVCALLFTNTLTVNLLSFDGNDVLQIQAAFPLDSSYAVTDSEIELGCFSLQLTKHHIWVSSWKMKAVKQYNRVGAILATIDKCHCISELYFPSVCDKDKHGNVLCVDRKHGPFVITKNGDCVHISSNKLEEIGMCFAMFINPDKLYVLSDNAKNIFEHKTKRPNGTIKVFKLVIT